MISIENIHRTNQRHIDQLSTLTTSPETFWIDRFQQIHSSTLRVKDELDDLRHDFNRIVSAYDDKYQTDRHTSIDMFHQFKRDHRQQQQTLHSSLTLPKQYSSFDVKHSTINEQRMNKQHEHLPRQASALLTITTNSNPVLSSFDYQQSYDCT
jgi:hypothetical protein